MVNKSKKPLVIIILLVLIAIVSIAVIFYARETKNNEVLKVDENISTKELKSDNNQDILNDDEIQQDDRKENMKADEEDQKISDDEESNEDATEVKTNNEEIKEVKKEEIDKTSVTEEKTHQTNDSSNESSNNVEKDTTSKVETPVVEETPKQEEPKQEEQEIPVWESYGMSEYDYYNKPMWAWQRVDFSISKYGTEEAAHQACITAGEEKKVTEEILSFSCLGVNSTSGDYLGDMLRIK